MLAAIPLSISADDPHALVASNASANLLPQCRVDLLELLKNPLQRQGGTPVREGVVHD